MTCARITGSWLVVSHFETQPTIQSILSNNTDTTECLTEANMASRSSERGFMEPIKYTTYYEDVYTNTTNEDDFTEARTFDLCEDSSEDEQNQSRTKHTRKNTQHPTSYGSIKKPTCKKLFDLANFMTSGTDNVKTDPGSRGLNSQLTRLHPATMRNTQSACRSKRALKMSTLMGTQITSTPFQHPQNPQLKPLPLRKPGSTSSPAQRDSKISADSAQTVRSRPLATAPCLPAGSEDQGTRSEGC